MLTRHQYTKTAAAAGTTLSGQERFQYNEFPNDQDRCRYWSLMTTSECCAFQDWVSRSLEAFVTFRSYAIRLILTECSALSFKLRGENCH